MSVSSKMLKVLKYLIYDLYQLSPFSLRKFAVVFLMFETKFTIATFEAPTGYVTRITPYKSIDLSEEADNLTDQLHSILKAV
ncbi:unnamed protein product [Mucor hiemalis]